MKNLCKLLLVSVSLMTLSAQAAIAVIVHPSNDTKITKVVLKKIFLGKTQTFGNGTLVTPVNLVGGNHLSAIFNKKILNRSRSQIASRWAKLEFTGTGTPPENKSEAEILALIAQHPEMIGYVDASAVSDKVKVVMTID